MASRRQTFSTRGFTLIELMVALFMVAVLTVSLSMTLQTAFKFQSASERAIEPSRTAELAMELMRNDFQNTLQPTTASVLVGNYEGAQGGTSGNDADVIFFTSADSPQHVDGNGDVKEVEFTTEQDPNNPSNSMLVRRVVRNLLSETIVLPDEEVICRNVKDFTALYFDGTNWNTTWDSTQLSNTVPLAVRIELSIVRPTGRLGSDEIINYSRTFQMYCSTTIQTGTPTPGGTGPAGSVTNTAGSATGLQ